MKTIEELSKLSKYFSLLLRHDPKRERLDMDEFGYVSVNQICERFYVDIEDIDWIIENNNKNRFSYNKDHTKIRANQGHSIPVILNLIEIKLPVKLYHGTTIKNLESIKKNGLLKMGRQYVHLSDTIATAKEVGMRYAKKKENLLLLKINTKEMLKDHYKIFISENNIFLIEQVPFKYLKILK